MTTTVVYADPSDTALEAMASPINFSGHYNGAGVIAPNPSSVSAFVGQQYRWDPPNTTSYVYQYLARFEVDIGTDTVLDADLAWYVNVISGAVVFTVEARKYNWGTPASAASWVKSDDIGALPLVASWAVEAGNHTLRTFTPNSTNLIDAVEDAIDNLDGSVRLLFVSDRTRTKTEPSFNSTEHVWAGAGDLATTAERPRLVIEHEPSTPDSILEIFDGTSWEPLALEVYNGTSWEPLTVETVTTP